MRWRELRIRAAVAARRRLPGGRAVQRTLVHDDLRDMRRLEPVSNLFGLDRGTPIERWYVERFLSSHAGDIRGQIAEIGDATYARRFGTESARVDVLDFDTANRRATVIANLETGEGVPSNAFACVIATQTLMFIYDVSAAISQIHVALKPGGVLLGSVSGISQISELDDARSGDYWRFTSASVERLLRDVFGDGVQVRAHGNVLTACAFLNGLAAEELTAAELERNDPRYQLVIVFRAVKVA